jgi:seryl-tRNA synthetase
MLSIQLFRQNKEKIIEGLKKKHFREIELVHKIISIDEHRRHLQAENDAIAAVANSAAKNIGQLIASGAKHEADALKTEVAAGKEKAKAIAQKLAELENELAEHLVKLPNLPHESVPEGKTPEENQVVRTGGTLPDLTAQKLPHWELTEKYRLVDFELGNKITGSGFPVYMGQGARLQRALIRYFLEFNIEAGYFEYYPPYLVNEASAYGTGQLPDKEGQMYQTREEGFYLIPTAEVPVTNIYRDTILSEKELPVKMTAYTPCFRREAGSYGKDVRGLNRVHQFDKVEIVQITRPGDSYDALEAMVQHVERLLQSLELPYRILRLCGGDMSFSSALTYDFEVYSAGQDRWLEVSSVSNFENYQSNRLKTRYRDEAQKIQPVHTLNGSSLALPRILASLLENFQTPDGIRIPAALVPYFGKDLLN